MIAALRHALRSLRRSPAFTLTIVATLAIGIGLNAAIFTVVDCVLLRPLGYHDADRIVALRTHFVDENRSIPRMGGDDYVDLSHQVKGFEATAFYQNWADGIELNGAAMYLPIANVSPDFGRVLGIEPIAGHLFHAADTNGDAALVSAAFAREHFSSPSAALGQVIHWLNKPYSIVGVLPEGFSFPEHSAVWFESIKPFTPSRTSYGQQVIGKRRIGVSERQLAAELDTFTRQLQRSYVDDRGKSFEAVPLQEQLVGNVRPVLRLLMGSVAVLLLIVCANITHLQLVRSMQRMRATTIRTALGASRRVLAGHALIEALLLATAGCAAAVLLAVPALRLLIRFAPPDTPRLADIHLNLDVLLFSVAISGVVMTLTAILPVWRSWHVDPATMLRQDASRGVESRGSLRLRNSFVVAEVALTLMLSIGAMLLTRELIRESRQELGFSPQNLVTLYTHAANAALLPFAAEHATPEEQAAAKVALAQAAEARTAHLNALLDTVARVPGVESAAAVDGAPMTHGGDDVSYAVKGRQVFASPFKGLPRADVHAVTPNLFAVMGVPLLRGRGLSDQDRYGTPLVLVINDTLARTIFPGQDPVGQVVMCGFDSYGDPWTIVGVVADIRDDAPNEPPAPTFYIPVAQHPVVANDLQIVARIRGNAASMAETLSQHLRRAHPEIAVKGSTMLSDIGDTEKPQRFRTLLFSGFALVSILLAAVGMYGVTSYSVAQRRFEFSLRIALGANRLQVLGMVLRKGILLTALGIGIGIALSFALTRVLASVIGTLPAFDLIAYTIAALAVLTIALLATLLPAQAAANVDPMTVLRSE